MEIHSEQEEPPSWVSIVKKEKKFSLDVHFNFVDNNLLSHLQEVQLPPAPPAIIPITPPPDVIDKLLSTSISPSSTISIRRNSVEIIEETGSTENEDVYILPSPPPSSSVIKTLIPKKNKRLIDETTTINMDQQQPQLRNQHQQQQNPIHCSSSNVSVCSRSSSTISVCSIRSCSISPLSSEDQEDLSMLISSNVSKSSSSFSPPSSSCPGVQDFSLKNLSYQQMQHKKPKLEQEESLYLMSNNKNHHHHHQQQQRNHVIDFYGTRSNGCGKESHYIHNKNNKDCLREETTLFYPDEPQDLSMRNKNSLNKPKNLTEWKFKSNDIDMNNIQINEGVQDLSVKKKEPTIFKPYYDSSSTSSSTLIPEGPTTLSNNFNILNNNNNNKIQVKILNHAYLQPQPKLQQQSFFSQSQSQDGELVIVEEVESNIKKSLISTKQQQQQPRLTSSRGSSLTKEKEPQPTTKVEIPTTICDQEGSESVSSTTNIYNNESSSNNVSETEAPAKRRGRRRKDEYSNQGKSRVIKPFDCFLCSFTTPREPVLKTHMYRMHTVKGNRGNVRCTICAYSCPSVEELRSHQELIHTGGNVGGGINGNSNASGMGPEGENKSAFQLAFHACTHCSKKFRSHSQLEAHLRLIAQKQIWKDLKARSKIT